MTHRTFLGRGLLGFSLALLAGCAAPTDEWQPSVSALQKTNQVEFSRLAHTVHFASGAAVLSPAEAQRLGGFLDDADIFYGDHIYLAVAANDSLSQKRQAALRRTLAKRGVLVSTMATSAGLARGDEMVVQLERAVVTPPNCPDWTKPPGGDPTNSVGSNFGCATATNLGLMVAQPRDLLVGRQPGPSEASPGLSAIQNYRAHKPIVLPDDFTSSGSSSGSGAGASSAAGAGAAPGVAPAGTGG